MRQISHELVRAVPQPELPEDVAGALLRPGQTVQAIEIAAARLEALAGEPDVLECGETEEQVGDLKGPGDAEPGQRKGRLSGDIAAVQLDGAGVGPQRSRDEVEHGALASAIRADDRGDAQRRRLEAEIAHCPQPAEGLVERSHLDHGAALPRAAVRRRASPMRPSGKNMTNTMKMTPRTRRCRSV